MKDKPVAENDIILLLFKFSSFNCHQSMIKNV